MISSLGYLRFESADVAAWREFGVKILGMTEGRGPEAGALYLRMDDFPARLVIVPGSSEKLLASGWEVRDAAALAAVGRALSDAGVPYKAATDAELAARRVGAMITRRGSRMGTRSRCSAAPRSSTGPRSARTGTGSSPATMGLGHVVLPVPPGSTAAFDFYTEVLGFRLRDSMRMPAEFFGGEPGDPPVWFRFLGCNARHHSLALAPVPAAAGVVHLMVETALLDDVGLALDRCARRGATVSGTLGRHANDLMVSFYVRTPGGFDIEYGTDGRQVDDASWITRETTAVSLWGHNFAAPTDRPPHQPCHRSQLHQPHHRPPRRPVRRRLPPGPRPLLHRCHRHYHDGPGRPAGFACQAFAALSLTPPLVLFCPGRTSSTWPVIERAGHFCANVLTDGQQELARRFGTSGGDKFAGVPWSASPVRRARSWTAR